jgi:hypothetical protein
LLSNLACLLASSIEDWALPGDVEISLDGHVCGCCVERSGVGEGFC